MSDDKTPFVSYWDRLGPWCLQTAALLGVALLSSLITRCTGQPVMLPPVPVVVSIETPPGSLPPTITVVHPSPQP